MKGVIIIIFALAVCSLATNFDISSTTSCIQTSATGQCTKWYQNGTVVEQTASCFPPQTFVKTMKRGVIMMKDLEVGQKILGFENGQEVWTEMIGWFHKQSDVMANYIWLFSGDEECFMTSPHHNIADEKGEYIFAEEAMGQKIMGSNKITRMLKLVKKGMYAPMTLSSNYFVFSGQTETARKFLAHNYANIRDPVKYEPIVNNLVTLYETLWGRPDGNLSQHPLAAFLTKYFGFLME